MVGNQGRAQAAEQEGLGYGAANIPPPRDSLAALGRPPL